LDKYPKKDRDLILEAMKKGFRLYFEKLKVYGDQVKNVVVKSMVDTAHGGQKMLKDVLPGNLVTREFEVFNIYIKK